MSESFGANNVRWESKGSRKLQPCLAGENSGTGARILGGDREQRGGGRERRHIGRGQSREWSVRPNRWKEIYSSRALAAGLKYGVDVETPPLLLPPPPPPPQGNAASRRVTWKHRGITTDSFSSRPVCWNRTGIRGDSRCRAFFRRRATSSRVEPAKTQLRIATRLLQRASERTERLSWTQLERSGPPFFFPFSLPLPYGLCTNWI